MSGPNWKSLLIAAVVAATLALGVSQAEACWGCGWGYAGCCSYSCYTPCYSTCYTPCYSSCYTVGYDPCCTTAYGWYVGYRPGPIRRLLFGRYRWYYGGWSTCYSVPCCTEVATAAPAAAAGPTPTEAQKPVLSDQPTEPAGPTGAPPAAPPPPEATPESPSGVTEPPAGATEPPAEPAPSAVHTRDNSGLLTIYVPYDAKIEVNGLPTHSKGSRRQYVSYGLKPGFSYTYKIRAEVVQNGQTVEDVRTVTLTAGDRQMVTFPFNRAPNPELLSRR